MESIQATITSKSKIKSIFHSKTFWGAVCTCIAGIAPIVGNAVKENHLSVDATVNIVIILATTGATVAGRVQANDTLVFTPDTLPGPNKADF